MATAPISEVVDNNMHNWSSRPRSAAARGLVRPQASAASPVLDWSTWLAKNLAPSVEGYASYVVSPNGLTSSVEEGNTRSSADAPGSSWSSESRMWLASVSKSITATATMRLLRDYPNVNLDTAFYKFPNVASKFPDAHDSIKTVTLRNLLTMKSGMVPDGTLWWANAGVTNIWTFLTNYFKKALVGTPGETEAYSNTNFTIVQMLFNCLLGNTGNKPDLYADYVTKNVLCAMQNVDPNLFTVYPDPLTSSTLAYYDNKDTMSATYFPAIDAQAAGGWVTSPQQLSWFLQGLCNNDVLTQYETGIMITQGLGWYPHTGLNGTFYSHNGMLTWRKRQINTIVVVFGQNCWGLLLFNSSPPANLDSYTIVFDCIDNIQP